MKIEHPASGLLRSSAQGSGPSREVAWLADLERAWLAAWGQSPSQRTPIAAGAEHRTIAEVPTNGVALASATATKVGNARHTVGAKRLKPADHPCADVRQSLSAKGTQAVESARSPRDGVPMPAFRAWSVVVEPETESGSPARVPARRIDLTLLPSLPNEPARVQESSQAAEELPPVDDRTDAGLATHDPEAGAASLRVASDQEHAEVALRDAGLTVSQAERVAFALASELRRNGHVSITTYVNGAVRHYGVRADSSQLGEPAAVDPVSHQEPR